MLIDFTVKNYRSIKEPVTLSAIASRQPKQKSHGVAGEKSTARSKRISSDIEIATPFEIANRDFELLPVVGIFGANASGKSNVLRALDELILLSSTGDPIGHSMLPVISPFRLSAETENAPTHFSLRVLAKGDIFIYKLAVNSVQIIEESMRYIPINAKRFQDRLLFERIWDAKARSYVWKNGADFTNAYQRIQENLAKEVAFAGFLGGTLRHPKLIAWQQLLASRLPGVFWMDEQRQRNLAVLNMARFPQARQEIAEFIKRFDTGISGLEVTGVGEDNVEPAVWATHKVDDRSVQWSLQEESHGTQRLMVLAHKVIVSLRNGTMLVEDELGANIHPNITREIIKLFQSEVTNPKRAQLIFTSHDNTLQRNHLLRRDQIWFTEKRGDGSTNLYPLTDFRPRNDLALDQAYLDGRFGAVPILPATEDLLPQSELVAETVA